MANVPAAELVRWQRWGFTHVWLMGVWETAPGSLAFSRKSAALRQAASKVPGYRPEDITGSPYAITGYHVAGALGGEAGLAAFRRQLAARGLKLLLDFIPNHTGLGHPWLAQWPELFVNSPVKRPETFRVQTAAGARWIAHGKDPFFPVWTDTAQLDYRNPATRAAMTEELKAVSQRCDGARCDMAMLVLQEVFAKTWDEFPSPFPPPPREFWAEAIPAVKAIRPDFLFLAEAYWDSEPHLLELGFDYAYDKRLLDLLLARNPPEVQRHLFSHPPGFIEHTAHFLENHDEPRIAARLSLAEHRAAALLVLGLPGMRLLHEGQLTGATIRANIHLNRRPPEAPRPEIAELYERLLTTLPDTAVGHGQGTLIQPAPAWAGNPTDQDFVVVQWQSAPAEFDLVVINLAAHASQCYARLEINSLDRHHWRMADWLGPQRFEREGTELRQRGLYLDLPAHGAQLFHFTPIG